MARLRVGPGDEAGAVEAARRGPAPDVRRAELRERHVTAASPAVEAAGPHGQPGRAGPCSSWAVRARLALTPPMSLTATAWRLERLQLATRSAARREAATSADAALVDAGGAP